MALPRHQRQGHPAFGRGGRDGRTGVIVQHPAVESPVVEAARDGIETRVEPLLPSHVGVLESRLRDEARLEGVQLAAREMAHLMNNDLAVAVGLVDLVQARTDLPPQVRDLLSGAASSLDAVARHLAEMQTVVRVVVKETPIGTSLDLDRSRP